jgi:hypothetical protein
MQEVKTGFYRNKSMQTGSSGTLIGWKSGQTTFVPLWDRMEGAWLRTLGSSFIYLAVCALIKKKKQIFLIYEKILKGSVAKSYMTYGLLIYG